MQAGVNPARVVVAREPAGIMHCIWMSGGVFQLGAATKAAAHDCDRSSWTLNPCGPAAESGHSATISAALA